MTADVVAACRAEIDRLRAVEAAATRGPWHHGDRQMTAGVMPERFGEGRCAHCERDLPLTWSGRRDINGTLMFAHVHTYAEPWHAHGIYADRADGDVLVVNDTAEYGYMDDADAEFIAASRAFVPAVLDAFTAILDLHEDWHVCVSGNGHGATDYCDDEPGMGCCPTVAAVCAALGVQP